MSGKRKAVIAGNDISEIYTFLLGGYEQKVLIEGKPSEYGPSYLNRKSPY